MHSRPQKLAAEFLGAFAVVFFGAGAVCADQFLRASTTGGIGLIGPLGIALAYGLAFMSLSAALAQVSGAHFNPAVTLGFWVTRRFHTFDTLSYWLAQMGGSVAAAYTLRVLVPEDVWQAASGGTPDLMGGLMRTPALLIEGLATFFFVFVVFAGSVPLRESRIPRVPLFGGLALVAASLFSAPFTGGAMNPARAFGPAWLAHHWTHQGVYWVGPLAGGVLAAWICQFLIRESPVASDESPDRRY